MIPKSISIMVSTYNWPEALERCINSIFLQDHLPDEIIIADDGSREETLILINKLKNTSPIPIIHVWQEDHGFRLGEIRNKAIIASNHEYIIQIDGDIILDSHFISDHISLVEKSAFLCGSRVWITQEQSAEILENPPGFSINRNKFPISTILNSLRNSSLSHFLADKYKKNKPTILRGCNMSFWKSDLLSVNGYNEDIQGWGSEDAELAIRLINKGVKKRFLKFSAVAYHLYHKENSKANFDKNEKILNLTIQNKITWVDNGIQKNGSS
ncbi:glycosyltransferase family 2 protein [Sphingobacterium daejeonense]|uniref:Glycosyltransferase family 2 protein n=1 Tax=Sphingobacterium daejeonense TaxID=371142 RepID=A0ABW3RHD6_9SPHI